MGWSTPHPHPREREPTHFREHLSRVTALHPHGSPATFAVARGLLTATARGPGCLAPRAARHGAVTATVPAPGGNGSAGANAAAGVADGPSGALHPTCLAGATRAGLAAEGRPLRAVGGRGLRQRPRRGRHGRGSPPHAPGHRAGPGARARRAAQPHRARPLQRVRVRAAGGDPAVVRGRPARAARRARPHLRGSQWHAAARSRRVGEPHRRAPGREQPRGFRSGRAALRRGTPRARPLPEQSHGTAAQRLCLHLSWRRRRSQRLRV